ncbi:response regulator [Devriesea agamarum]|uniref:response regulator n=1 Tax=Devriesea agamarum TaxID=472569 RepID=UPI00071CEB94|nr:response regulator transcription factor [Devriesea agamarum]
MTTQPTGKIPDHTAVSRPSRSVAGSARSALRVLIADDHAAVRAGLRLIVETADGLEVVGEVCDGPSAVELAKTVPADIALVDVRMPGATGIGITPDLRALGVKVLVISSFDLDDYVLAALRAGADGYLVKTEEPHRIVDSIRRVAEGDAVLSPEVTRAVVCHLTPDSSAPNAGEHNPPPCTPTSGAEGHPFDTADKDPSCTADNHAERISSLTPP